jgi:hypothetical protein
MKLRHNNVFGMLFQLLESLEVSRSQQRKSVGVANSSGVWHTCWYSYSNVSQFISSRLGFDSLLVRARCICWRTFFLDFVGLIIVGLD